MVDSREVVLLRACVCVRLSVWLRFTMLFSLVGVKMTARVLLFIKVVVVAIVARIRNFSSLHIVCINHPSLSPLVLAYFLPPLPFLLGLVCLLATILR